MPFRYAAIAIRGTVLVKNCDRASQCWLKGFYNDNSGNCCLKFPSVIIMSTSLRPRPTHSCTLHKYNKNRCLDAPLGNKGRLIPGADYFLLHIFSQKKKIKPQHSSRHCLKGQNNKSQAESFSIKKPQKHFQQQQQCGGPSS